ncbi:MAG: aminotransferase class I/II-fold pyridoxal phosphate-dependent enzyme, partial [bacterium]
NPSGSTISMEDFEQIVKLAAARGVWIITDECYCRLLYDGVPFSAAALPGAKANVVVAGSLSKTYAMTGWRIGYALAPEPIVSAMVKVQSQSVSHPSSVAQKAAVAALRGPQDDIAKMLAEYRRRRDFVIPRLRSITGVACGMPRGAFYAYPDVSAVLRGEGGVASSLEFTEQLLLKQRVAVVPSEAFGGGGHIRISFATSMGELQRGLDRIESFIRELVR